MLMDLQTAHHRSGRGNGRGQVGLRPDGRRKTPVVGEPGRGLVFEDEEVDLFETLEEAKG